MDPKDKIYLIYINMNKISNYVDKGNKIINNYGEKGINIIKNEVERFIEFIILDKKIITVAIGFIIATQTNNIATLLIDNYLSPVIYKIITYFTKKPIKQLEDYKKTYLGIEFKIGMLIINLSRFIIILVILYYLCQLINPDNVNKIVKSIDNIVVINNNPAPTST
jgi:large-conductance mechanosensitive channel